MLELIFRQSVNWANQCSKVSKETIPATPPYHSNPLCSDKTGGVRISVNHSWFLITPVITSGSTPVWPSPPRPNYFLKGLGYKLQYSAVPEPTPGSSYHSTHSSQVWVDALFLETPPPKIQELLSASPVGWDLLQQLHLGRLLVSPSPPPSCFSKKGVGLVDLYHIIWLTYKR